LQDTYKYYKLNRKEKKRLIALISDFWKSNIRKYCSLYYMVAF